MARFRNGFLKGRKKCVLLRKSGAVFCSQFKPEIASDKEWKPSPASILFPRVGKEFVTGQIFEQSAYAFNICESHGLVSSFSFFKDSANMMFALFTPAFYCNVGEYFASYRIMCRVVFNNQSPWRCILQRDRAPLGLEWWYLHQWILQ